MQHWDKISLVNPIPGITEFKKWADVKYILLLQLTFKTDKNFFFYCFKEIFQIWCIIDFTEFAINDFGYSFKQNQRALNKAQRDLDRERTKLEAQEKKLIVDIKKSAQKGAAKVMAKDLVRTRKYIQTLTLTLVLFMPHKQNYSGLKAFGIYIWVHE
jgi:hypothetical protein